MKLRKYKLQWGLQDFEDAKSLRNSLKKFEGQYCSWSSTTCILVAKLEGRGYSSLYPDDSIMSPEAGH